MTVWSHVVDGTELNDFVDFITQVPEVDTILPSEAILVQAAGDYPWFHRMQPREGLFTFLIQMLPCTWQVYDTRRQLLDTLFAPGPHTYTPQVRGATTTRSFTIISEGNSIINPRLRQFTIAVKVLPA